MDRSMAVIARTNVMDAFMASGNASASKAGSPFDDMFKTIGSENDNVGCPKAEVECRPTGLVLRAMEMGMERCYQIVLVYKDEARSQVIASYQDDTDIIADWRHIGAELQLPLFIMNSRGELEPASYDAPPAFRLRRFGSPLSGRRPRFLRNRKEGQPCLMAVVVEPSDIGTDYRF